MGLNLWFLFEYLLHRFAMHALNGFGIMSREHLLHHVTAGWSADYTTALSWLGVGVVGGAVWFPLGLWIDGWVLGLAVSAGWVLGYGFYEYQHAMAHLRAPRNRYERWVRFHHFHHHFGHPRSNHGVSMPVWDVVFRTYERPTVVRVPRRLAVGLGWLLDDSAELRAEYRDQYVLVGAVGADDRQAGIDRARAFASLAPTD